MIMTIFVGNITMRSMLGILLLVRFVMPVEQIMENVDRVIHGHKFTLTCPIKEVSQSGMFRWLFEPLHRKEYDVLCTKPPGEADCTKPKSDLLPDSVEVNFLRLYFEKASSKNSGTYQCKYIDEKIIFRYYFNVNILTPPGKPEIHTIPQTLTENIPVKLVCKSDGGNPKPLLEWLWKDFSNAPLPQPTLINSTLVSINATYGLTTLSTIWLPKSTEDGNSISCQAKNSFASISSNWMYLNINYRPVIYNFESPIYYGLLGSDLRIECKAASKSTATFKWKTDKGIVVSDDSYLIINPLRTSDKGSYSCVVTNSYGNSSATLDIKVLSKPIINITESVIVNEWETLSIKCNVVPSFSNVTWWFGNRLISASSELKYNIKGSSSFEIQCRASVMLRYSESSNVVSSVKTVTVIVHHIPLRPTISANPNGLVLTGSDVTLTCVAKKTKPGLPKPDYIWMKKGSNWMRNGTNFLSLTFVKFEDSGEYGCKLFNRLGSSEETYYQLIIEGQPVINGPKMSAPKTIFTRVGRPFKIECLIQGRPTPNVKWYKNEVLIQSAKNVSGLHLENIINNDTSKLVTTMMSALGIDEPSEYSEDIYRCSAENKYGTISQAFIVKVIYPPKMISNVYILAANVTGMVVYKESISLNCSVMASPNITISWIRKLINYNEKNIENDTEKYLIIEKSLKRITGIESILYIRNFQNEDFGRYLCIAKNSEGHIETNFEIRKFSIPDPAHNLVVESKSLTTLTLRWTSGFDGGYPQIFTVSYSCDKQKQPIQIRTMHANVTLKHLLPDALYHVNVSSSNEMGNGASILSIKAKTSELTVDRDQLFYINKDDRVIELSLPSNLSSSVYCLTIEQMDRHKTLNAAWTILQKCIKSDVKKFTIDNLQNRFRMKICLISSPDICSEPISPRLESTTADSLVSTKLIGTVAAICTALVIVLAILLFFILLRSKRFFPVMSDLKGMKHSSKSSYTKDDLSNFNDKSSTTPICHKKQPFMKPGSCPLLNTYSCDQVNISGNPIEILNVCVPHNIYMEGLYSTLVKNSSISPFPYDATQPGSLQQPSMNNISSCCCQNDQQAFNICQPAFKTMKPEKVIYEVMV